MILHGWLRMFLRCFGSLPWLMVLNVMKREEVKLNSDANYIERRTWHLNTTRNVNLLVTLGHSPSPCRSMYSNLIPVGGLWENE